MTDEQKLSTSNIQKALKESRSKKANLEESDDESPTQGETTKQPRVRLSDEERAERIAAQERARIEKRVLREEAQEAKRLEKLAARDTKVPHMAKVEKQAKNLPALTTEAQEFVTNAQGTFDESALTAIIAHLTHGLRVLATRNARTIDLVEGQLVRILAAEGSNSKWVGHLGHVLGAQRIRCYVQPVGTTKRVYLFSSNVQIITDSEIESPETGNDEELVQQTA